MSNAVVPDDVEHVVIKLGVSKQGEDKPVFRNIPFELLELKSLKDVACVNKLKKLAVSLFFEGSVDGKTVLDDYSVSLKYNDSDGDNVIIYNDRDVYSAMRDYSAIGKVKVLATVCHNQCSEASSRASASTQTFVFNVENQAPPSDQPTPKESLQEPDVETRGSTFTAMNDTPPELSSSIADILRFAANVVGTATSSHASKVVDDTLKHVNKAAEVVEEHAKKVSAAAQANVDQVTKSSCRSAARAARQADRFARKTARVARRSIVPSASDAKVVVMEASGGVVPQNGCSGGRNAEFREECMNVEPEIVPAPESSPVQTPEREFIHGRHTCDACLTTPIIGKRFHAVNHADYDLCERCYRNYKGHSLRFEEERLDRDVSFQDRWHLRRAQSMANRRCGGRLHGSRHCQSGPVLPPAPQHPLENPPCARSQCHTDDNDLAVKEAIRRSLEDQTVGNVTTAVSEVMHDNPDAKKEVMDSSAESPQAVKVETVEESDPDYNEASDSSRLIHETSLVANSISKLPDSEWGKGENAASIEQDIEVFPEKIDDIVFPLPSAPVETSVNTSGGNQSCTGSNGTERISFVSDDEGTTAALLGSTLDRMAEAIDGLKWDLERPGALENMSSPNLDEDEHTKGAKIVDGDEDTDHDDEDEDESGSHDSWQVVAEEDKMARAAQALGSALFNSEIERSNENMSNLSNSQNTNASSSTGLSTLATVPSTVQSLGPDARVPFIQLNRWVAQLEQLHELGFTNDALNVDILESLSAANIGVDSDEEVSVQQVVNTLIKD